MTRLLMLACLLLVSLMGVELTHRQPEGDALGLAAPEVAAPRNARAPTRPVISREQWTSIILGRPLFTPDRKPLGDPVAAHVGLPRLTGIIASANEAMAIFQPSGTGKPMVARHGDRIAGWEVTTVAADAVSLQKADDRIVLRPRFNGSDAEAVVEPKPSRSRWEAAASTGILRARWANPQLQP